jgi:hypothetical protein
MNVDKKKAPVCSGALVHQIVPFLPYSSRDGATLENGLRVPLGQIRPGVD